MPPGFAAWYLCELVSWAIGIDRLSVSSVVMVAVEESVSVSVNAIVSTNVRPSDAR